MPTYQYACTACGEKLDAVQSFSDSALTDCPQCDGALRKVFSAVGVVFKGSGFYKTDSRKAAKSADAGSKNDGGGRGDGAGSKSDSGGDGAGSKSDSPGKGDAAVPAASKSESSTSTTSTSSPPVARSA